MKDIEIYGSDISISTSIIGFEGIETILTYNISYDIAKEFYAKKHSDEFKLYLKFIEKSTYCGDTADLHSYYEFVLRNEPGPVTTSTSIENRVIELGQYKGEGEEIFDTIVKKHKEIEKESKDILHSLGIRQGLKKN